MKALQCRAALLIATILMATACSSLPEPGPAEARSPTRNMTAGTTHYVGGFWLVPGTAGPDADYVRADRFSQNGVFVDSLAEPADRTVDLSGLFIIPPLADGHNHWIEGPWTDDAAQALLEQGVFYYKNPSSPVSSTNRYRAQYDRPDTIDVTFSLASLSVSGSHPEPLYQRLAPLYNIDPEALDGEAFYDVPDVETLEARWDTIIAAQPDFLKLIFLDIQRESPASPATLSVAVAERAIELAHAAGLRVSVHGVTAADFRTAAELGADDVVHLPGWEWAFGLGGDHYRITPDDASRAAQGGLMLVTTASIAAGNGDEWRNADHPKSPLQTLQSDNLKTLRAAGLRLFIGVDTSLRSIDEVDYLRWLDFSDDASILRDWVRTGPDYIFPDRAIGRLQTGYEASFMALPCDPFAAFDCVRDPQHLEKQGTPIGAMP